ncbi:hypothetical protein N2152v2_006063 [Parachlorella kessleri]
MARDYGGRLSAQRLVTEEAILDVLRNVVILQDLSKFGGGRSPQFVLEKRAGPSVLRVVFAQAPEKTVVVTVVEKGQPQQSASQQQGSSDTQQQWYQSEGDATSPGATLVTPSE